MLSSRRFLVVAGLLLLVAVCAAYLPHVGKGFKQDDFGWIASSRVRSASDCAALLTRNTGFYRPAVAVTFTLDELAFGMRAFGYGLTNLALVLGCALVIVRLARALGLAPGVALAAGGIWALNFQGISMAAVWLSGRTALMLVLFAVLAADAFVRRQTVRATVFTLFALLSKEEAVMLPVLLGAWAVIAQAHGGLGGADGGFGGVDGGFGGTGRILRRSTVNGLRSTIWRAIRCTWPLALPLIAYVLLRSMSGAFGPLSAPVYYRFTFAPRVIGDNAVKYLDFAATWPAAVVVLASLLAWAVPAPSSNERRIVLLGIVWMIAAYAVTVFLPIRSPLYACFPLVGTSLAAAALLSSIWSRVTAAARWRLAIVGLLLPFLLLPVYWARNARHAKGAVLSAQVLSDLEAAHPDVPDDHVLVLLDDLSRDRTERLPAAFGSLYGLAVRDTLGHPVRTWIEPPPDGWQLAGLQPPDPATPRVVFALRNGRLMKVRENGMADGIR